MRIWSLTLASLAVAAVVLAGACALMHRHYSRPIGRAMLTVDGTELAAARVDEQYKASALAITPSYEVSVFAGSGAPGARDGAGLYARLGDPVDLSLSPDGERILLLDAESKSLREALVATRQVSTIASYRTLQVGDGPADFVRVVAAPGGAFLADVTRRRLLFRSRDGSERIVSPAPNAPSSITDLAFDGGRLFVLDGPRGQIAALTPGSWTWTWIAEVTPGVFDRLCVNGASVVVLTSTGGPWQRISSAAQRTETNPGSGPVVEILWDRVLGRYLVWGQGHVFAVAANDFSAAPTPLTITNIEGRELGDPSASFGYHTTWLAGAARVAFDADRNVFYVLDRAERRVLRVLNSFVSWKYGPHAGNTRGFYSPEYSPKKPAGTTRILWLSHSVFWDPAGVEAGNLALGAPRIFEQILNEKWPEVGRWEVLNPALTGIEFYTSAYPRTVDALREYGLDDVVVVMDLQNLYWLLQFNGIGVPAAFNKAGVPDGVDVAEVGRPLLQREYQPPLSPLARYIKMRMVGSASAAPLLDDAGKLLPQRFMSDWLTDSTFRTLLLDAYVYLLKGLQKAASDAGARLTVLVAPASSFISPREWVDAYAMGTGTDFEAAHRPLLERLWRDGIPAYDMTYDMLSRHPELFPFNANSHHRSYLFHRALAESALAVADRFSVFPLTPQPAKDPWTSAPRRGPADQQAIVVERGSACFVLHDLWGNNRTDGSNLSFTELLKLGIEDVRTAMARGEYACQEYRLTFANVRNRDDYGNRDFRDYEQVATMTIVTDQLPALTNAAAAGGGDSSRLRADVRFQKIR